MCSCQGNPITTLIHLRWPLCSMCLNTDNGRQAFAVSRPPQLPAATLATSSNTQDCLKRALNASLFPWVDVILQMTAPLRTFLKGGYSKVYNINMRQISLNHWHIGDMHCPEGKGRPIGYKIIKHISSNSQTFLSLQCCTANCTINVSKVTIN